MQRTSLLALLLVQSLVIACSQGEKGQLVAGSWVVVGHQAAGISAMGRQEADSWVGKVAQYSGGKASFDKNVCEPPSYKQHTMQPQEFYSGFRISPESLGTQDEPIEVIEVYCGNRKWMTPGGTLIKLGKNKLFIFWDGVFFQLQQDDQRRF